MGIGMNRRFDFTKEWRNVTRLRRHATWLFVGVILTSASVHGQPRRFEKPTEIGSSQITLPDLLRHETSRRNPVPLVTGSDAEPIFIFPTLGSAQGSGLFFRSETTLINDANRTQDILVFWFPSGGVNNCARGSKRFRMNPQTWYVWSDFVVQMIGSSGIGAAVVAAVDANNNPDALAKIDGFSRIYATIAGVSGTSSQSFPSQTLNFQPSAQAAWGLRQDSGFRTNVGIFNYDVSARVFDLYVTGINGNSQTAFTVDACSLVLTAIPGGTFGVLELDAQPRDNKALWYGFGSSVDNFTGDSWSSIMRQ